MWPPMRPGAGIAEGLECLRWLDDDHLTYRGYREIVFQGSGANAVSKVSKARGLGILRDPEVRIFDGLRNLDKLPPDVRDFMHRPQLLHVTKANRRATVHRAVAPDTIAVKTFDATGKETGQRLFDGLFPSMASSPTP